MKIKTGLMTAILIISGGNNISIADSSQDAVLGASFAKCTATLSVFHKLMPSLGLPANTKEEDKKITGITGMFSLASHTLIGKEEAEKLIHNEIVSTGLAAKMAIKNGYAKNYTSHADNQIKECMNLLDSNIDTLKPKMEAFAIAEEQNKK